MADVSPKESIMSLITTTPDKRQIRKDTKQELDTLEEEESLSCLKWPENAESVEDAGCLRCLESVSSMDKKSEMEITNVDCQTERLSGQSEEKPNLKRRQNSLDKRIADGEGSFKKMKISGEPQDEQAMD